MSKFTMISMFMGILCFAVFNTVQAQDFDDYIEETRGDTVVVSDFVDMGNQANSLAEAIELDEDPPEGRVYELKAGGFYWLTTQISTPEDRPLDITGSESARVVQSGDDDPMPPIIGGTTVDGVPVDGGFFLLNNDFTLKNAVGVVGATDNSQGWDFINNQSTGTTATIENVLLEHTNWVLFNTEASGHSLNISDSYFVNMSGEACRRNGGVYDNVNENTESLRVENSTHVMAQGMMYKFRGHHFNEAFFNHNTFVNVSGHLFPSFGYHTDLTVTNNLFVNSHVQGYFEGLDGPDEGSNETDQDNLPHGIINVNELPDGTASFEDYEEEDRMILVYNNGVFWDERLDDIVDQLNDREAMDRDDWVSQMMFMNDRTQDMFDNEDDYPMFQEDNWIEGGDPDFNDPQDLMTDQVDELIQWSVETGAGTDYTMSKWRMEGNETSRGGDDDNFNFPDWPIPVDLAYSNNDYLSAGLGALPLGDLNWFPDEKEAFVENRESLHDELQNAKESGEAPQHAIVVSATDDEQRIDQPTNFTLEQNYPNPFNPNTQITFTLQDAEDVQLKVYDVTGRLVATLVDESMNAGTHTATWNAVNETGEGVSSGVYIYQLTAGDQTISRTMTFMK